MSKTVAGSRVPVLSPKIVGDMGVPQMMLARVGEGNGEEGTELPPFTFLLNTLWFHETKVCSIHTGSQFHPLLKFPIYPPRKRVSGRDK